MASGHDLAMALRNAYLAMHRRTDATLGPDKVTADQFVVLATLVEGDAMTQTELASRTSSDPNTLRAMLVLLEERKLIQRQPHPTDGRARTVSLTTQGRNVFQSSWQRTCFLRNEVLMPFHGKEADKLIAQLRGIVTALAAESNTESGPDVVPD